jgi:hypothetical protein
MLCHLPISVSILLCWIGNLHIFLAIDFSKYWIFESKHTCGMLSTHYIFWLVSGDIIY